jgi:hypothetical protein
MKVSAVQETNKEIFRLMIQFSWRIIFSIEMDVNITVLFLRSPIMQFVSETK